MCTEHTAGQEGRENCTAQVPGATGRPTQRDLTVILQKMSDKGTQENSWHSGNFSQLTLIVASQIPTAHNAMDAHAAKVKYWLGSSCFNFFLTTLTA